MVDNDAIYDDADADVDAEYADADFEYHMDGEEEVESFSEVVDMAHDFCGERLATTHTNNTIKLWRTTSRDSGSKGSPSPASAWSFTVSFCSAHRDEALRVVRWVPPTVHPAMVATVGADGVLAMYEIPVVVDGNAHSSRPIEAKTLRIDDADKDTCPDDNSAGLDSLAFAEEGGIAATMGKLEHVVRVYKAAENGFRWGLLASVNVGCAGVCVGTGLSFRPRTSRVLCAGRSVLARGRDDWDYIVHGELDAETGEPPLSIDWGRAGLVGMGREDGFVEIWEMDSQGCERIEQLPNSNTDKAVTLSPVLKVQWDTSGEILASAHADGMVYMWAKKAEPLVSDSIVLEPLPWRLLMEVKPGARNVDV